MALNPLGWVRARVGAKPNDQPHESRKWTAIAWWRQSRPHGHYRGPLSKRLRRVIVVMAEEGKKPDEIAAAIGCHQATVYRWLKRARQEQEAKA